MLPRSLGRFVYRIVLRANHYLPFTKRPRTRVVVVLNDREILLIKNWFGSQLWTFPGGGIKPGERPEYAAARELFEETGMRVHPDSLAYVGEMPYDVSPFSVLVYRLDINDTDSAVAIPAHARLEITDMAWYSLSDLPADRHTVVDQALAQ